MEDYGGRPIHRAREYQKASRRENKGIKRNNWHRSRDGQILALLIIDPTSGDMTENMKRICGSFEKETGMRVVAVERAGSKVKQDCKSEPLRDVKCKRKECFCCSTGEKGNCERNSLGYSE